MSKSSKNFDSFVFETQTQDVRGLVLGMLSQHDVPADVAVASVADVLAILAATIAKVNDHHSLNDRLHSFCARVQETYERVRNSAQQRAG